METERDRVALLGVTELLLMRSRSPRRTNCLTGGATAASTRGAGAAAGVFENMETIRCFNAKIKQRCEQISVFESPQCFTLY